MGKLRLRVFKQLPKVTQLGSPILLLITLCCQTIVCGYCKNINKVLAQLNTLQVLYQQFHQVSKGRLMSESLSEQCWSWSPKPEERPSLEAVGMGQAVMGKVAS